MAAITSIVKVGNLLVITYDDGVVVRRSIVYDDTVVSEPPANCSEVGNIYINADGHLVINYNGSSITIDPEAEVDLTGAEIVALLEALTAGSRLELTYIDDGATYIRFTATERSKLTSIEDSATADQTGAEMVTALEALAASSRLSHTKLDDVGPTDHHDNSGDHAQNTDTDLNPTFEATFEKVANKGAVSGYASLDASTKVVEQPASITDHLEDTPSDNESTKAPTSEWAYEHVAAADPHTGYIKHSLATVVSDFLAASGAGVFVKKTLAEVKTILGLGSAAYTAATDYVTHALATVANDFLVASGSGVYIKKTLAETLTILGKAAASGLASLNASTKVVEQPASITDHLDDTAGGTNAEVTKAPTSNVMYDHGANTTTAHGAVSAATASKHVVRDAAARAKFAQAAAAGDVIVADANVRAPDSTLLEGSSKATVQDHTPKAHTIASHSDTTGTGAQLNTLVGGGETDLHSHAGDGGGVAIFGDGSDGDVTVNADPFTSGTLIVANELQRDAFFDNLTIENTRILITNGFRIFVKDTLTNAGTIKHNGNDGTNGGRDAAGVGGAALAAGSLGGSAAGANGKNLDEVTSGGGGGGGGPLVIAAKTINNTGTIEANGGAAGNGYYTTSPGTNSSTGNAGNAVSNSVGGSSGEGGNTIAPAARNGGIAGTATPTTSAYRASPIAVTLHDEIVKFLGGAGGGSGAIARTAGLNCAAGGSGGGGGGCVVVVYLTLIEGTIQALGGAKSVAAVVGSGNANDGGDGSAGNVIKLAIV